MARANHSSGGRLREWGTVALAALLLVLLAVLAALQYHWLGRASEADLQRTSSSLQAAASRLGADFNRELVDLVAEFVPALMHGAETADIVAGVERWRERAPWPELVEGVWEISAGLDHPGRPVLKRLDRTQLAESASPELRHLADLLAQRVADPEQASARQNPFLDHPRVLMAEVPAIVVPRPGAFRHGRHGDTRRNAGDAGDEPRRRRRWRPGMPTLDEGEATVWIIHLNLDAIRDQILPALAQRHFSAESEIELRILDLEGRVVWASATGPSDPKDAAPDAMRSVARPVARAELFGPLRPKGEPRGDGRPGRGLFAPVHEVMAAAAGIDRGQWLLEVIHSAGSLDAAVRHARHRSMALSLFILLVLAGSVLLLAHGARRAQALARRQLEFVAGVTHELRTPVAALRSAGQNLADGVVKPEKVQTYGRLVDREGRRLEEAVAQILAFAGLSNGPANGRELRTESLDPLAAVESTVSDLAPLLQERNVEVEVTSDESLPRVRADAESLRRALRNLLQNAALHGQPPERDPATTQGWVGVRVAASKGRVLFHVTDHGPGVDPADRKRIFEPFVRGRGLAASNVPGSGLGLALVRQVADAHGGSIHLRSDLDATTFTLSLPAVLPED